MRLDLPAGKYVVAVSGGVDSVVLLVLLAEKPSLELTVAHFDHGIRADSSVDREFVATLAEKYNLPFVYDEGKLGASASEGIAREKRYEFLEKARVASGSGAIITAHHQDDLLETAIINLLRGTGRRGLSSLKSTDVIRRPLLGFSKLEIKNYALANKLAWREDPSNQDTKYLRNYVRHEILAKTNAASREELLDIISANKELNQKLDKELTNQLHLQPASRTLARHYFIMLPHRVGLEVLATWLRANEVSDYDAKKLAILAAAAKTARAGTKLDINKSSRLVIGKTQLALERQER